MKITRTYGPLLFFGITVIVFCIVERWTPWGKGFGEFTHYGLAFLWSAILTVLLWITLESAHIIPHKMKFRTWTEKPWNPIHTYVLLTCAVLVFGILSLFQFQGHSGDFLLSLIIASNAAVILFFYWTYRLKIHFLVAGILCILLAILELMAFFELATSEGGTIQQILLIAALFLIVAFFFWSGIALIRRWRNPGSWQGSWRSFLWGMLIVFSLDLTVIGVANSAVAAAIPLSVYLMVYASGKFMSISGRRHPPGIIDEYTRSVSPKHFLQFALADRSEWQEVHRLGAEHRATFTSITDSLFDIVAFVAVAAAILVFAEATVAQQLSFAFLVIVFHVAANLNDYHSATRDIANQIRVRLEEELRAAHDMQMGLMPKEDPAIAGFDIAATCVPANEVGGDFYDYIWLDGKKSKLGIVVADVSGKAMKAAMTAVMTSGMLYSEVQTSKTPREILAKINHPLYLRTDRRVFTALAFALLDTKKNFLTYSSAGQTPPVLVRNGRAEELRVQGMRLPLGLQDELEYRELKLKLRKGDLFVLFTDGVVESMNSEKEMYGFERLQETLAQCMNLAAADVRDRLLKSLKNHAGAARQHDDMTVVVVKVL